MRSSYSFIPVLKYLDMPCTFVLTGDPCQAPTRDWYPHFSWSDLDENILVKETWLHRRLKTQDSEIGLLFPFHRVGLNTQGMHLLWCNCCWPYPCVGVLSTLLGTSIY